MPKSLPRRVENLEQRSPKRDHSEMSREEFVTGLEVMARERWPGIPEAFWPAWARYVEVRDRLRDSGDLPPADYRPDLSPGRRRWLWFALDSTDPELRAATRVLLDVLEKWNEAFRAAERRTG